MEDFNIDDILEEFSSKKNSYRRPIEKVEPKKEPDYSEKAPTQVNQEFSINSRAFKDYEEKKKITPSENIEEKKEINDIIEIDDEEPKSVQGVITDLSQFFSSDEPEEEITRAIEDFEKPEEKYEYAPRKKQAKKEKEELEEDKYEYRDFADASKISNDLDILLKKMNSRNIILGICFILSMYLSLCNLYPLALPAQICPENNMKLYIIALLIPLVLSILVSMPVIINGIVSLLKVKMNHDTSAAICTLVVLMHTITLLVTESLSVNDNGFYAPVAVLILFTNSIGKHLIISRIRRNFNVVRTNSELIEEIAIKDNEFVDEMMNGQGFEEPVVVFNSKIDFPEKFLTLSYSIDESVSVCRITTPLFLLFGIISSILTNLKFGQGLFGGLNVFCAIICVSSGLTETLLANLPMYKASKTLTKEGAFIGGYASTEEFEEMSAIAVNARELYSKEAVVLNGIKTLDEKKLDTAIVNSVNLLMAADGVAKDALFKMIGEKKSLLSSVSHLRESSEGISGIINGDLYYLGSREYLKGNNVAVPEIEVENKLRTKNRSLLYIGDEKKSIAILILTYKRSKRIYYWLKKLEKKDLSIILYSSDPNINPQKISEDYGIPEEYICEIPDNKRDDYLEITKEKEKGTCYAAAIADSKARFRLLSAIHTLKSIVKTGTILEILAMIAEYTIVAYLAFFGSLSALGFDHILLYKICFTIIVMIPSLFARF